MSTTPKTDALLTAMARANPDKELSHGEWYELCNHARALERQNAELLEALQIVQPYADRDLLPWVADIVRKAISKATE